MPPIKVKIFLSSPGDVSTERALAKKVIKRLQRDFIEYLKIIPTSWEEMPLESWAGFQDEIERLDSPSKADVVIFILWSRLGTPLGEKYLKPDGTSYTGTEYEFEVSLKAKLGGSETPHILAYIKKETYRSIVEPDKLEGPQEDIDQARKLYDFLQHQFYDQRRAHHKFMDLPELEKELEENLRQILQTLVPEGVGERRWEGPPFRGLQVFDFDHEDIFFGRGKPASELIKAFKEQARGGCAFVMILGKSGSGKSSVARAGVAPFICSYLPVEGVNLWRRALLRPTEQGEDLLVGLAAALLHDQALPKLGSGQVTAAELSQVFRENSDTGLELIKEALNRIDPRIAPPGTARLLLIVDQLEEIFRPSITQAAREEFVRVLAALATSGVVWVLATMRSDYYARVAELPELMALKEGNGQYDLLPPKATDLEQMIRRPADMAQVHFESRHDPEESLDQVLLNEAAASPESLPLLEYTLDELYKRRISGDILTFAAYDELGGMMGALARRAEAEFQELSPVEQTAAQEEVFPALVSLDPGEGGAPVRKYAAMETVTATPPRAAFVEKFVAARLLIASRREDGGAVVSWAHDALLTRWQRLKNWIERNRELLRAWGRLAAAAARWQAEPVKKGDLLLPEGKQLAEAREVLQAPGLDLTPAERAFVQASMAKARRRTLIRWGAVASLAVLTLLAGYQWQRAVVARNEAERQTRAAEQARNLALKALHEMIFYTQDKLAKVPGTIKYRQELLKNAAEDLINLSKVIQSAHQKGDRLLGVAYSKIGDTLLLLGQDARAQEMYQKALQLAEHLIHKNPDSDQAILDLSVSYQRMGDVDMKMGEEKAAREYYEKSLQLIEQMAHQNPDNVEARRNLSLSYNKLGDMSLHFKEWKAAKEYFEKSLQLAEQLIRQEPKSAQARRDLSISYDKLGKVNLQLGDLKAAREYFEKSLQLAEQLGRQEPNNAESLRDLSISYQRLGDANLHFKEWKAAREYFEKSLQLREQLARQDPENAQALRDLSISYDKLGQVSVYLNDRSTAREYFEKSLQITEKLARQDPDSAEARRDLSIGYLRLGGVSLELNDPNTAREYFEKSLQLSEQLAHQDPDDARLAMDLVDIFYSMGLVNWATKQYPEARDWFQKALDQLHRLEAQGKLSPTAKEFIAIVEKNLNALADK